MIQWRKWWAERKHRSGFGEIAVTDTCAPERRLAVHWQPPRFYIFQNAKSQRRQRRASHCATRITGATATIAVVIRLLIPVVPMTTMAWMTVTVLIMTTMFIRRYDASYGRCGDTRGMADVSESVVQALDAK